MISIIFLLIITITTTSSSATLADADVVEGAHHLGHDHHPHHPHPHDHHPHHYNHHHILICHLSSQSGKGGGKISSTRGVQWLRTLQTRSSGEVLVNLELFRFSILQSRVERLRTVQARCLSSLKKTHFPPCCSSLCEKSLPFPSGCSPLGLYGRCPTVHQLLLTEVLRCIVAADLQRNNKVDSRAVIFSMVY